MGEAEYKEFGKDEAKTWTCGRNDCTPPIDLSNLKSVIDNLQKKLDVAVQSLQEENKQVAKSAEYMGAKYDELLEKITHERAESTEQTEKIQVEHEDTKQYLRRNNIIIHGIPETGRDVYQEVILLAKTLDVNLQGGDIDVAHRLPTRQSGKPKPIVLKLVNRWKKEELLKAKATKKDLTSADLGYREGKIRIYMNDHLTPLNDSIAKRARDLKKDGLIHATWIRNTKVYIQEKEEERSYTIKNANHMQEIEKKTER